MKYVRLGGLVLMWCLAGSIWAQDFEMLAPSERFEISPFYGYRFGGEVVDSSTGDKLVFKDAPAYGLFLDLALTEDPGPKIEMHWSRQNSRLTTDDLFDSGSVDLTIDYFQIGGSTEWGDEHLSEYVSASVGATHYDTDGLGSDTKFSFSIGVGGKYHPWRHVALRVDLRGYCTVVEAEGGFLYHNGVTVVSFSGSSIWQGQATIGASIEF